MKEQPYHGGTFTGNHCHRYIKHKVYEKLTDEIKKQTDVYTNDHIIKAQSHLLKTQFDKLNDLFYKVHDALSHTKPIDRHSCTGIQKLVDNYIGHYTAMNKSNKIPKHHILQYHCVPFIKRHGFGLGLLGEQGTEASHQTIAKISTRSMGINNEMQRLKFVMTTHILNSSPSLFSCV